MTNPLPPWIRFIPAFLRSKIVHRPELLKILSNISWLLFARLLRSITALIVAVWVAKYLGPADFGKLNFAIAIVGLFSIFAGFGMNDVVIREISRDPDNPWEVMGSALSVLVFGGFAAFILVLITIKNFPMNDPTQNVMVIIVGISLLFKPGEALKYLFEAQLQTRYIVWVDITAYLLMAGTKIALIYVQAPLVAFAWTILGEVALAAIGRLAIYSLKIGWVEKWQFRLEQAKSLLRDSWPLMFSGLILMVQARIDQVMLGSMAGEEEVGFFSVAYQIIEAAAFISIAIRASFIPSLTKAHNKSEHFYEDRLTDFYRLNLLISIVIALPIGLLGSQIVGGLFGSQYQPAGIILSVMSIQIIFVHMGTARGVFLLNENLMKYSFFTMAVGTLINILLNSVLIPRYAGIGATLATIVAFTVTIFIVDIFYKKARGNLILMMRSMLSVTKLFR